MPKTLSSRLSLMLMAIFLAIGAALVGLSLRMPQARELVELGAELVIAAIAFALLAALLVFQLLTRRLRLLADAMEAFRATRFTQGPALDWSRPDGDEAGDKDSAELRLTHSERDSDQLQPQPPPG